MNVVPLNLSVNAISGNLRMYECMKVMLSSVITESNMLMFSFTLILKFTVIVDITVKGCRQLI